MVKKDVFFYVLAAAFGIGLVLLSCRPATGVVAGMVLDADGQPLGKASEQDAFFG